MKKEVSKKEDSAAVESKVDDNEFNIMPDQDTTAEDISIPKVLIMQGQSPRVLDGDAQFGDLVDTLNWEVMASIKRGKDDVKTLEVVPVHWEKYWIIKKADGQKWKTVALTKMTPADQEKDPYEKWDEGGVAHKRIYLHVFYIMIKGKTIPYTIGFRGSSREAGKAFRTQMYEINKTIKAAPYVQSPMGRVIEITPVKTLKDDNTFVTLEIKPIRESTLEEAREALKWNKALKSGKAKADHSDIMNEGQSSEQVQTEY